MEFHGVDVGTQFKRMRDLVPEAYRAFLDFDQKAFKDGALPGKTKELMALGIAQITQCPWCIQAHTRKAALAGASDAEIAETTFVAMAMAAGAAWSAPVPPRTQGLAGCRNFRHPLMKCFRSSPDRARRNPHLLQVGTPGSR